MVDDELLPVRNIYFAFLDIAVEYSSVVPLSNEIDVEHRAN